MACDGDILRAHEYRNWLKACLALKFTQEGLCRFVCDELAKVHRKIFTREVTNDVVLHGPKCNKCTCNATISLPCKVQCARCVNCESEQPQSRYCRALRAGIQQLHIAYKPCWENADDEKLITDPQEMVKCYMPDGYRGRNTTKDTSIINVLINCKYFHEPFQKRVNDEQLLHDVFLKAGSFGTTIQQSTTLKVTDQCLSNGFIVLRDALTCCEGLQGNDGAMSALSSLIKIEDGNCVLSASDEYDICIDMIHSTKAPEHVRGRLLIALKQLSKSGITMTETTAFVAEHTAMQKRDEQEQAKPSDMALKENCNGRNGVSTPVVNLKEQSEEPFKAHPYQQEQQVEATPILGNTARSNDDTIKDDDAKILTLLNRKDKYIPSAKTTYEPTINRQIKPRGQNRESNTCIDTHQGRKRTRSGESINTIQLVLSDNIAKADSKLSSVSDIAEEINRFLNAFGKYPIYRNKQNIIALLVCPQDIEAIWSTAEFQSIDLVSAINEYDELVIWGDMDGYTILPKSLSSAHAFTTLSKYMTIQSNNPYNVRVKSTDLLFDAGTRDRTISISTETLANEKDKSKVVAPKSYKTFAINVPGPDEPKHVDPLYGRDHAHARQRTNERVAEIDQLHAQASSDGYRSFNVQPSDASNGPITYESSFQNTAFSQHQATNREGQDVSPVGQSTNLHGGRNHPSPQYQSTQTAVRRQTKPPRYPDYIHSAHRQSTYTRWPRQQPTPMELTNAGFFYTNQLDLVRCYQCGIGLKDFANSDDPMKEHIKHSGDCDFLLQQFGREDLEARKNLIRSQDPELNRQVQLEQLRNRPGPPNRQYNPRHPEYSTYEARLSSFSRWPPHLVQTPQQLADAGLYYTGIEDHARCFACDGGLRKWDPEDDPWMEHCRWFPACPFAIQVKGVDFIELVQASSESEVNGATGGSSTGYQNDIVSEMNHLTLVGTEFQRIINEHKTTCLEMGYLEDSFTAGVNELRQQGNVRPDIEDIITAIDVVQKRQQQAEEFARSQRPQEPETPEHLLDENKRLKSMLTCLFCEINQVNALFLPCTHHKLCFECASGVTKCPICDRFIKQKIRTYMS